MNTLSDRLKLALKKSGLKKIDLAKSCGITRSAVSFWFSGQTQALDGVNLANAAKSLGVSPYWLATGKGPMTDKTLTTEVNHITLGGPRTVPIISYVQAGKWREIVDTFPPGGGDGCVKPENERGRYAYALRVEGDSMLPVYTAGDIIVVDPDVSPNPGDCVIAKNHKEEATFKKYRPRGRNADGVEVFELVPLNDDYATLRSDTDGAVIIGTVVEHIRVLR